MQAKSTNQFTDIDLNILSKPDFDFNKQYKKRIFKISKPSQYYILNLKNNFYLLKKSDYYFPFDITKPLFINIDDFNKGVTNLLIGSQFLSYPNELILGLYLVDEDKISVKIRYIMDSFNISTINYIQEEVKGLNKILVELSMINSEGTPEFGIEKLAKDVIKKQINYELTKSNTKLILSFKTQGKEYRNFMKYLLTFLSILHLAMKVIQKKIKLVEDPFFKEPIIYKILKIFFENEVITGAAKTYQREVVGKDGIHKGYISKKSSVII